ncbi:MAG: ABC transporter ATP-binding protein [Gammaproteobacteria bacterium]|nr:ABC transporter ATP-binding protein [Gammaproteobacteria bacterium]
MIELQAIQRDFNVGDQTIHALQQINLTISQGEYVSIMGPSGSGKSTLLNVIGLLDRPSSGTYTLDQAEITALSDDERADIRQHKIGFIFQFFQLLPRLTAQENVELPMLLAGTAPFVRQQRARKVLQSLDILDRAGHRPDQLSGGQQQRVAIARATVMQPKVILADEPTGNLDRHSGREVIRILERLNGEGMSLIVVTHDPEVGQRAKRHIRMIDGKITHSD